MHLPEQLLWEMKQTAPAMEALLEVTLDFDHEFEKDKRLRSLVDYSDLEHYAARLLTDEAGQPTALAQAAVGALRRDYGGRVPGREPGAGCHIQSHITGW